MELKVFERLILLNVLPREGDLTALKLIRKLREELSFSEEEHKALQFSPINPETGEKDGLMHWLLAGDKPKEVTIGEKANDIIVEAFKRLNKEKKLKEEHIPVYELFVKE